MCDYKNADDYGGDGCVMLIMMVVVIVVIDV